MSGIMWGRAPVIRLGSAREWNELVDDLKRTGRRVTLSKCHQYDWIEPNSYNWDRDNNGNYTLYVTWRDGYPAVRYLYKANGDLGIGGPAALKYLSTMFERRSGVSLRKAFGVSDREEFSGYQYSPITFTPEEFIGRELRNVWKADCSSAYPYQATKTLPDLHRSVRREGRVRPSDEFPFAFHLRSNQLSIFNELDTREMSEHFLATAFNDDAAYTARQKRSYGEAYNNRLHINGVRAEDDVTILCKESRFSLADVIAELYAGRKENDIYKAVLNLSIGTMSSARATVNPNGQMRHITSVIYARHIKRMMDLYDTIVGAGGVVLSIATDAIMWASTYDIPVYDREKRLGAFYLEHEKTVAWIEGQGFYALEKDGKVLVAKHQGLRVEDATLHRIKRARDIANVAKTAKTLCFDWEEGEFFYG